MTATRSHIRATIPKSCVMKSIASPIRVCTSLSSMRYWSWIVTSSAVVGFVRDQELRLRGERDRTDHALLHAAAHLVGERAQALLGRRHLHAAEGVHRARPHVAAALGAMGAQRLLDLVADREHRVQRGLRVLQDHRDPAPAHPAHVALALRHEVLAFEQGSGPL